jgi:hypothetical protein
MNTWDEKNYIEPKKNFLKSNGLEPKDTMKNIELGSTKSTCRGIGKKHPKTKTQSKFIEDSIKKHGNRYDYSRVHYTNSHTKIQIY